MSENNNEIRLEIDHNEPMVNNSLSETVSKTNKVKILAALAIIAIAGYAAHWVQEPTQLKADFLDGLGDVSTHEVSVSIYGFEPADLAVKNGDKVVWTNTAAEDQTLIGEAPNGDGFASPVLATGESFEYIFSTDTDFEYYSTFNPAIKGKIKVGAGSAESSETAAETTTETITETNTTDAETVTESTTETTSSANTDSIISQILSSTPTSSADTTSTSTENMSETSDTTAQLTNVTTLNTESTQTEIAANTAKEDSAAQLHGASYEGKLAGTGPEDILYVAAFGVILYFNRKKLTL